MRLDLSLDLDHQLVLLAGVIPWGRLDTDATQIWDLLRLTPLSAREIGEAYGVSRATIEAIRYGRSWNSVTGLASAQRIHRPEAQRKTTLRKKAKAAAMRQKSA